MAQDLRLEKKLPIALRNDFWIQLMKSIEDEILLMKGSIEEKLYLYSINKSTPENLYILAETLLGDSYGSFRNLKISLSNVYGLSDEEIAALVRKELNKLSYQIMYKGDILLYKTFFNSFGYSFPFEMSIYTTLLGLVDEVTGFPLIKRNLNPFLIEGYNPTTVLGSQKSDNNFLGISVSSTTPTLDHIDKYQLDLTINNVDSLDKQEYDVISGTKHIAFEVVIKESYFKGGIYSLFPYEILLFIKEKIKYYKKASEVPHVGAQLSVNIDNTGYWDSNPQTYFGGNLVLNSDFSRDVYWLKGTGWTITNNLVTKVLGVTSSLQYSQPISLTGNKVQFTITIESIRGTFQILDGNNISKASFNSTSLINGVYIVSIDWDSTLIGFSIKGLTTSSIMISSLEVETVNEYTESEIHLKAASNLTYLNEGISEITSLKFGYGNQELPSVNTSTLFPTELGNSLAEVEPFSVENFATNNYVGAISNYVGQFFNRINLHDSTGYLLPNTGLGIFDGVNKDFSGSLPSDVLTLQPKSLVFGLKSSVTGNYEEFIEDNGNGILIGQNHYFQGTINYTTGKYELSSEFVASIKEEFPDMDVSVTSFVKNLSYKVISGGFIFNYKGSQYSINIDEIGNLTSNFSFFDSVNSSFTFGTTESSFEFIFTDFILLTEMKFVYQFNQSNSFSSNYSLKLYRGYTKNLHAITEVGVYGKTLLDNNIKFLAYMTFAPIELYSNEFHLNFGTILEKK